MKKRLAYKLSDGRIIEDKKEASKLQKEIDFKRAIYDFAEREGTYCDDKKLIYDSIINNIEELRNIFNTL